VTRGTLAAALDHSRYGEPHVWSTRYQDESGNRARADGAGSAFAASLHPMWIFDRATHDFIDVNDAVVRRYGYTRRELLAMTILDIRPATDIPELLRQTLDPRLRGSSRGEKYQHQAKDGTVFPVAITSW
jgi:PAS domain S-box-containing protein